MLSLEETSIQRLGIYVQRLGIYIQSLGTEKSLKGQESFF